MKMLKSKKGFNDITIIAGILGILLLSAAVLPRVQADLEFERTSTYDLDEYQENIKDEANDPSVLSGAYIIGTNLLRLGLWDIGDTLDLAWYVDIFYSLMGLILIITVVRNIWPGGGS